MGKMNLSDRLSHEPCSSSSILSSKSSSNSKVNNSYKHLIDRDTVSIENICNESLYELRNHNWTNFFPEMSYSEESIDDRPTASRFIISASLSSNLNLKSNVMRLDSSDMGLYGLYPETDLFCAVICDICQAVIKPQGLKLHIMHRHGIRELDLNSHIEPIGNECEFSGKSFDNNIMSGNASAYNRMAPPVNNNNPTNPNFMLTNSSLHKSAKNRRTNIVLSVQPDSTDNFISTDQIIFSMASNSHSLPLSGSSSTSSNSSSNSIMSSTISTTSMSSSRGNRKNKTKIKNINNRSCRRCIPIKDREYSPDLHCGVLTGDPPKPCTRSFTCKSHALSLRRMVPGRSKSFDKLLSDHRLAKSTQNNIKSVTNSSSINNSNSNFIVKNNMDIDSESSNSNSSSLNSSCSSNNNNIINNCIVQGSNNISNSSNDLLSYQDNENKIVRNNDEEVTITSSSLITSSNIDCDSILEINQGCNILLPTPPMSSSSSSLKQAQVFKSSLSPTITSLSILPLQLLSQQGGGDEDDTILFDETVISTTDNLLHETNNYLNEGRSLLSEEQSNNRCHENNNINLTINNNPHLLILNNNSNSNTVACSNTQPSSTTLFTEDELILNHNNMLMNEKWACNMSLMETNNKIITSCIENDNGNDNIVELDDNNYEYYECEQLDYLLLCKNCNGYIINTNNNKLNPTNTVIDSLTTNCNDCKLCCTDPNKINSLFTLCCHKLDNSSIINLKEYNNNCGKFTQGFFKKCLYCNSSYGIPICPITNNNHNINNNNINSLNQSNWITLKCDADLNKLLKVKLNSQYNNFYDNIKLKKITELFESINFDKKRRIQMLNPVQLFYKKILLFKTKLFLNIAPITLNFMAQLFMNKIPEKTNIVSSTISYDANNYNLYFDLIACVNHNQRTFTISSKILKDTYYVYKPIKIMARLNAVLLKSINDNYKIPFNWSKKFYYDLIDVFNNIDLLNIEELYHIRDTEIILDKNITNLIGFNKYDFIDQNNSNCKAPAYRCAYVLELFRVALYKKRKSYNHLYNNLEPSYTINVKDDDYINNDIILLDDSDIDDNSNIYGDDDDNDYDKDIITNTHEIVKNELSNNDNEIKKNFIQSSSISSYNNRRRDFPLIKRWYRTIPKPSDINQFPLKRSGGGMILSKKLLNFRKIICSNINNYNNNINLYNNTVNTINYNNNSNNNSVINNIYENINEIQQYKNNKKIIDLNKNSVITKNLYKFLSRSPISTTKNNARVSYKILSPKIINNKSDVKLVNNKRSIGNINCLNKRIKLINNSNIVTATMTTTTNSASNNMNNNSSNINSTSNNITQKFY